ncbi:MAG: hypothetical protein ACPGLV_09405, partial [Bacteroidia bacterium]
MGSYLMLKKQKAIIKHCVKKQLISQAKPSALVTIVVNKDWAHKKLDWEHDKEFEYKGRMYDVISSKTIGDSIYYTCFKDDEETAINQEIKHLVFAYFDQNPIKKSQHKKLIQYYKTLYFQQINDYRFAQTSPVKSHQFFS